MKECIGFFINTLLFRSWRIKKGEADVVNFPGISNQLFAAIDADKGDDTNQNHCTGGTEADDVFQILRAIFFETHFFVSTMNVFFSRETCDVCTLLFLRQPGKCVRVIFIPGADAESTSNFCGIFGDSHSVLSAGVAAGRPSVRSKKTAQSWKTAVPP